MAYLVVTTPFHLANALSGVRQPACCVIFITCYAHNGVLAFGRCSIVIIVEQAWALPHRPHFLAPCLGWRVPHTSLPGFGSRCESTAVARRLGGLAQTQGRLGRRPGCK